MESGSHIRLVFGKANKAIEEIDRLSIGHTGLNITDFMILEGHPFDYRVLPLMVFIDGKLVHQGPI